MDVEKVCKIYNHEYAINYNENFLLGPNFKECTEYETNLLESLLNTSKNWLDVACGTGYYLNRFNNKERVGLDISPAFVVIIRQAKSHNLFFEFQCRDARPEWNNKWDLVSCMWYAYCYAGSVFEVEKMVCNLIDWTAIGGCCYLPVCDPDNLCKSAIPFQPASDSTDGRIEITAIVWNWIDEPSQIKHTGLIAPHLKFLTNLFLNAFEEVQLFQYPTFLADVLEYRKAIIATKKRNTKNIANK